MAGHPPLAGKRILTLGIRNESNTFSTAPTRESDFTVQRGPEVLAAASWAAACKAAGVEVISTVHAYAWPGGVVEKKAFEKFRDEILAGIRKAGPLDGVYMEMHGALHVEGYDDAQASLVSDIRQLVGTQTLIAGSFDLHGNLSPAFVQHLNLLSGYRTAPHRDVEETRQRAVNMLLTALAKGLRPHIECITIPILVPGEKSITDVLPLKAIYEQIPAVSSRPGLMDASIFAGYCWADLPRSAMRVFVVAESDEYKEQARKAAEELAQQIWDKRQELQLSVPSGSFAAMLQEAAKHKGKTVFISDSGDNTTAGAPGDNTHVLATLLEKKTKKVLVAGLVDPEAFAQCSQQKVNETIRLSLGGKTDYTFSRPVTITGKILYKSAPETIDNKRGAILLDIDGVSTVILNNRRSFTETRDFREIGVDPLQYDIVVVKLGYLFPQLRAIAPVQLMALTAGFCNLDIPTLPYKRVARPSYPLDLDMSWSAIHSTNY